MSRHHVVLVPGFFGFGSLGELTYFIGVRETLERAFERYHLSVNVVEVPTLPTASIRHRAARLNETLAALASSESGPIHIVGHSTGGLDARLAIAPTASLPVTRRFHEHERLRTLVTLSTPHFGSPLASFFGSAAGTPILRTLSSLLICGLKHGHMPLGFGLKLGGWVVRKDEKLGFERTAIDDFFGSVIADFSPERRAELIAFIEGISKDQSLIFQLTPAGCDLLNASTADPDSLHYGCIVCRAREPTWKDLLALKPDPFTRAMRVLYFLLHRIAASADADSLPEPVPEQRQVLAQAFGEEPVNSWCDGIVPTLSQVWGEVIHVARADHLDTVGHYGSTRSQLPSTDWLPSRSGFDDAAFSALWSDVARFISEEALQETAPRHRRNVGVERTESDRKHGERAQAQPDLAGPRRQIVTATDRAREALRDIAGGSATS